MQAVMKTFGATYIETVDPLDECDQVLADGYVNCLLFA